MAKLYFRYGSVSSAKTLNLLAVAHNYRQQDKKVLLIKPELDTRFGKQNIKSRTGLSMEADICVTPTTVLNRDEMQGVHCILVDEAQFLSTSLIDQLRAISVEMRIPVICYGLRTDFRTQLFEGAKRLMEIADSIEEVKTTCAYCNRKAVFNLKLLGNKPTLEGASIDLGCEEKYLPTCAGCYEKRIKGTPD